MKIKLLMLILWATCAQAAQKPNILFIAIDDLNDWTGFLGGHPQAQTPNMDKLAERGVNFTNAHCSAPGCSPSRNALLYGVEPFKSGLYAFYAHTDDPDEWTNLANIGEYSAVKKRLAAKLPQQEAPIVMDGLEGWSIPVSADKPLAKKSKTRPNQKRTSSLQGKNQ